MRKSQSVSSPEYDYVIVGAGAAGCVVARRLADAGSRILLLEAGTADDDWRITFPFAWPELLRRRRQHWIYESRVDDQKAGDLLAGKVLGGSSSVNALAFVRGHRTDYDGWEKQGLKGYGFADVLPYFRRMERWEDGASALRGGDGPISVTRSYLDDPLTDAFMSGALTAGHALNNDYNGAEQDGFGPVQAMRIVDASVMPSLVGGNIYACVTMLAEKASDLILSAASKS